MTAKVSLPQELGFSCICNDRTMVLCRILNRSWDNIAVTLPVLQKMATANCLEGSYLTLFNHLEL